MKGFLNGSVGISLNVVVFVFAYFLRVDELRLVLSWVDKLTAVVSPAHPALHSCSRSSENLRGDQVVLDKY